MNINSTPAITPGATPGSVTSTKVCAGPAPQVAAARSSSGSSPFTPAATAHIMKGELMTQAATPTDQTAPSSRKSPKSSITPMPEPISGTVNGSSR